MIKVLNKVVPILALLFVFLLGLLTVPGQINNVKEITDGLYGTSEPDTPTTQNPPVSQQQPNPSQTVPEQEAPKFNEDQVGQVLVDMVGRYGINVNGLTAQGDGTYTIHLYGDFSILKSFLEEFGKCELEPKIGDFSLRESSTYLFLMNAVTEDNFPLLYKGSLYDLFAQGNPQVIQQMESLANTKSSSQYYLILTFFVNPA